MWTSDRFRLLAGLVLLGAVVWWFYPREGPPIWYSGTAPNPERLAAERPTVELPVDTEHLEKADLLIDEKGDGAQELVLRANSTVPVRGSLQLRHVERGSMLIGVQCSAVSKHANSVGMLAEGQTDLPAKVTRSEDRWRADFKGSWTVPDHAGELFFIVEFHLFPPGARTAPRRFAVVRPMRITP